MRALLLLPLLGLSCLVHAQNAASATADLRYTAANALQLRYTAAGIVECALVRRARDTTRTVYDVALTPAGTEAPGAVGR